MKTALVCGGGGFIGHHLVNSLKKQGCWVRAVDLKKPPYCETKADDFILGDLRDQRLYHTLFDVRFDEVYQLAADMGGAGFVFTGENDAEIMHNSACINVNIVDMCHRKSVDKVFFSSSACIYPEYNQMDPDSPDCEEKSAYPAAPDSEYGWEKLFSERLYLAFNRNYDLDVRIARFHNIFGPEGSYNDGREKAPAALCRKIAMSKSGDSIEVWGDGKQTRSFLYIDECIEGIHKLMASDCIDPINIGSEEIVTINQLAMMIARISHKEINLTYIPGPQGVRGRKSDNRMIKDRIDWEPNYPLVDGMKITYKWINKMVQKHGDKIISSDHIENFNIDNIIN